MLGGARQFSSALIKVASMSAILKIIEYLGPFFRAEKSNFLHLVLDRSRLVRDNPSFRPFARIGKDDHPHTWANFQ